MTDMFLIKKQAAIVQQSCLCLTLQKAARLTARRFDESFRPLGITSGQYSLLIALVRSNPPSIGELAHDMSMDRTTITANIKPLKRQDLLEAVADPTDARSRLLVLTQKGKELIEEALPLWRAAQDETLRSLSTTEGKQLLSSLNQVTND